MKHGLLPFITSVALAVSTAATLSLASPSHALGATAACSNPASYRAFTGRSQSISNSDLNDAVKATIDPNVVLCSGHTSADFVYEWVSIGVGSGGGCQVAGSCLIQYGIYHDQTYGDRFAWAWGGCNGTQANIQIEAAGDSNAHTYMISRSGSLWTMYRDGTPYHSISEADSKVACWLNGATSVHADAVIESNDDGNSIGDYSGVRSTFRTIQSYNGSWSNITASCFEPPAPNRDYYINCVAGAFDAYSQ